MFLTDLSKPTFKHKSAFIGEYVAETTTQQLVKNIIKSFQTAILDVYFSRLIYVFEYKLVWGVNWNSVIFVIWTNPITKHRQ